MPCTVVFEIYVQEHSEFTNSAQNLLPYTVRNGKYSVKLQNTQHLVNKEKNKSIWKKNHYICIASYLKEQKYLYCTHW